ncbi:MAG: preprotein translocase subunit SecE [Erysipelotrichaceae bacterium]|nr:preprotein translocase subunit SecE [Erysipelotrichaceae bacterium]
MKWFNIEAIRKEIAKIRWPEKGELLKTFVQVVIFVLLFMAFFVIADLVVSFFLKLLGI